MKLNENGSKCVVAVWDETKRNGTELNTNTLTLQLRNFTHYKMDCRTTTQKRQQLNSTNNNDEDDDDELTANI